MKINSKILRSTLAALIGSCSTVLAAPFAFTNGDLILGFQAKTGTGANQNVFVNLGPATSLRDNGNQGTLANIGTTLTAVYGSDWYTREDVWFGVIGNLNGGTGVFTPAPVNGDPGNTFYVSTATATIAGGTLYPASTYSAFALASVSTKLNGMETMLPALTAEADGSAILNQSTQPVQWNNSWSVWNPVPGPAFDTLTGGIQQNFGKGGSNTYVDLQRVVTTNTGASPAGIVGGGTYETTIAISPTGAISAVTSSPSTPFDSWIGTFPSLSNPADKLPTADPDGDGVNNLLEFVLDGNPATPNPAIVPTLNAAGADFIFAFNRRDDSESEASVVFEYGSDLIGWTPVPIGTGSEVVGAATIAINEAGSTDAISVTLSKTVAPSGKLFGRLKVVR